MLTRDEIIAIAKGVAAERGVREDEILDLARQRREAQGVSFVVMLTEELHLAVVIDEETGEVVQVIERENIPRT